MPDWIAADAAATPPVAAMLTPSNLGGAKALAGDQGLDEAAAKARGTALHRLLEHLPQHPAADWPLLAGADDAEVFGEALSVLDDPGLAHLFGPDSLAEVPFAATLGGRQVVGTIDRLVVTSTHVLAVDFKSNRAVPTRPDDVPEGILRQLGAYAEALAQIWPDRRIEVAVLWTNGPVLMPLPLDIVRAALARTTIP